MIQPGTTVVTLTEQATSGSSVSNPNIATYRIEGLWVDSVSPWSLDMIWEYESITKSNTLITNL